MQTVGITGGIGSGKSRIAQELAKRGFVVYDCDREAKRIIEENDDVQKAIIALLGEEAFIHLPLGHVPGIRYNTKYVAKRVFSEPELLERLNAIVHPAVGEDIKRKMPEERTLLIESAILYEAGLDRLCDRIIVVDAPEDVRIARVIERDYHGEATADNINKVRARMRTQGVKAEGLRAKGERAKGKVLLVNNDGRRTIEQLATEIEEQITPKQDSSNR